MSHNCFPVFHCVKNEENKHTALYTVNIKTKNQTVNIFKIQNYMLRFIFNFCFSVEELIN